VSTPAEAPRPRKTVPAWLLEGIFIVVSVLLGFGVTQYGEYRDNREFAARALSSISAELASNRQSLEPLLPIHREWVEALFKADTSDTNRAAIDVYFALRPTLPEGAKSPFPFLRRSAWDAALAGGALRLIDYDTATMLSEIYRLQETATENVQRLANGALSSASTFDPADRSAAIRMLWLTMKDIETAESALLDLYRQHLPHIRSAAGE